MLAVQWNPQCFPAEWVGREGKKKKVWLKYWKWDLVVWDNYIDFRKFSSLWPEKSLLYCLFSGPYFRHIDPEWTLKENTWLFLTSYTGWGEQKAVPLHNIISLHLSATEMEDHKPKSRLRNQSWESWERNSNGKSTWRNGKGPWARVIKRTTSLCENTRHKKKHLFKVSEVTDTRLLSWRFEPSLRRG